MDGLTEKQQNVLNTLRTMYGSLGRPIGPTELGLEMGQDYNTASSAVTPALKRLVTLGLATMPTKGKYQPVIAE